MKTINLMLCFAAACLLVVSGCGKSEKTPSAPQFNGVAVDIPKLTDAFANSPQETKSAVTMVGYNIRYGKYEEALMSLDKLVNDPSTTEEQKKTVNQVIEQTKQLANAAPAAAAPAQ